MKQTYHIYIRKLRPLLTRQRIIFGSFGILIGISTVFVRPVFAQESIVGQVVEILREKVGFGYSPDSTTYIFEKDTPNYKAFSGTQNPFGGHRIMLERDGSSVELAFLTANALDQPQTGVLGQSVVTLTPAQDRLLTEAEEILTRESSASAQGRTPVPDDFFAPGELDRIASASALLDTVSPVLGTASNSAELSGMSPEAKDFALLLRLKSFRISQHALDIDMKLTEVNRDLSAIMSKAALVEEANERVVTFHNVAMGADLDYRLREYGIRQQIILNDKDKLYKNFVFILKKSRVTSYDVGGGVWYFRTPEGKNLMRIPKGWAADATGAFTNDVDVLITQQPDVGEVMVISVSHDWLMSPDRVFPVTVETSVEITPEFRDGKQAVPVSPTPAPTEIPVVTSSPSATIMPTATVEPTLTPTPALETDVISTQSATQSGKETQ